MTFTSIQRNFLDNLPLELLDYIIFMSIGSLSLDIHNKKKSINNELMSYSNENKLYLYLINYYEKCPELEMNCDDYYFVNRIPRLLDE